MRRLAYLVSQYPAVSHTFILREVRGLRALGFDVRVASVNSPDRPDEHLTTEEREEAARTFFVKRAGAARVLRAHLSTLWRDPRGWLRGLRCALDVGTDARRLLWGLFYFGEAVVVSDWMRREGLGHLHVHFGTAASTVALVASRVAPVTLSMTVHGPDEFYDAPGYRLEEKIEACDFVACIGTYARSQVMKLSSPSQWSKFEVSPLGVDPDLFVPPPPHAADGRFEVLCVGRLVPAKGQHVLLAAVERMARRGVPVLLRVAGDGPDRASLEGFVDAHGLRDHVVFEGAVNQDRVREFYARADAFALASFAEGIPVVLMEAMSMGIPCVSTCITGIPELIRDGIDGLLVPASDDEALADALERLASDRELRRGLGASARLRVRAKYDLGRNTHRLAEIYARRLDGDGVTRLPDPVRDEPTVSNGCLTVAKEVTTRKAA